MAAQLCGAGAPPDIVQSVLIELDHGATSNSYLASKKVLDLGEDASSFSGLLEAAAARFKVPALVPAVTWVYDGGPAAASLPAVSITSDHDLAALLATLRGPVAQGGHFRFQPTKTLNTDGAPTSNSGCCGNKGGSDSKASLSTLEDPAAVPAVLSEQALQLVVNGKPIVVQSPPPSLLLVDFLRDTLKLTGTKVGMMCTGQSYQISARLLSLHLSGNCFVLKLLSTSYFDRLGAAKAGAARAPSLSSPSALTTPPPCLSTRACGSCARATAWPSPLSKAWARKLQGSARCSWRLPTGTAANAGIAPRGGW